MSLTLDDIAKYAATLEGSDGDPSWKYPHAFHHNLPSNHFDEDGIPYITKYAHKKSRYILKLVETMNLTEEMFDKENGDATSAAEAVMMEDAADAELYRAKQAGRGCACLSGDGPVRFAPASPS